MLQQICRSGVLLHSQLRLDVLLSTAHQLVHEAACDYARVRRDQP